MDPSVPVVDGPYVARARELRLEALSRRSAVHTLDVDRDIVYRKCHDPHGFPQYGEKFGGSSDPYLQILTPPKALQAAFEKEAAVLAFSASLPEPERFAPELVGVDPTTRSTYTRVLANKTYYDHFVDPSNNDYRCKAEAYIDALVSLHTVLGKYFTDLYQRVRDKRGRPALRINTKDEDFFRWRNHFRTIIYRASPQFAEYLQSPSSQRRVESARSEREGIHKVIQAFLQERGIDLTEFVWGFVRRDWEINYGTRTTREIEKLRGSAENQLKILLPLYRKGMLSVVHGDISNPSNVFKPESEGEMAKACDLVDMMVAGRHVDVAGALFNFYNSPHTPENETSAIELMARYADGIERSSEGTVKIDRKRFIVRCLEDRLKWEGVRLFAVDCRYGLPEIRERVIHLPEYQALGDDELQRRFLQDMFVHRLNGFADYILRHEGRAATEGYPHARLLRENVQAVEFLLNQSGVLEELSPSAQRHERARAAARREPPSKP